MTSTAQLTEEIVPDPDRTIENPAAADDAETDDVETDTAGTDTAADTAADPGHSRRRLALPVALLVLAAALVATGVVLLVRAGQADDSAASRNDALVDSRATSRVIAQVSTGLNQVLSYDYRKPQVARAAADRWLTGDAPAQYRELFGQLQKLAPGQKLTLVAKVSTAGVTFLRGDTARLLVFLDQQSTRASDGQSSVAAAQVQITAVYGDGRWRIRELKPI